MSYECLAADSELQLHTHCNVSVRRFSLEPAYIPHELINTLITYLLRRLCHIGHSFEPVLPASQGVELVGFRSERRQTRVVRTQYAAWRTCARFDETMRGVCWRSLEPAHAALVIEFETVI